MSITCISHVAINQKLGQAPKKTTSSIMVAVEPVQCCECGCLIQIGECYVNESGEWVGGFASYSTCDDCRSIRASFFAAGFYYGWVWQDLQVHVNKCKGEIGEVHIRCLTPTSRTKVCDMVELEWQRTERSEENGYR